MRIIVIEPPLTDNEYPKVFGHVQAAARDMNSQQNCSHPAAEIEPRSPSSAEALLKTKGFMS